MKLIQGSHKQCGTIVFEGWSFEPTNVNTEIILGSAFNDQGRCPCRNMLMSQWKSPSPATGEDF